MTDKKDTGNSGEGQSIHRPQPIKEHWNGHAEDGKCQKIVDQRKLPTGLPPAEK